MKLSHLQRFAKSIGIARGAQARLNSALGMGRENRHTVATLQPAQVAVASTSPWLSFTEWESLCIKIQPQIDFRF